MTLARLIEAVEAGMDPGDAVLALPDQQTTDLFYAANRGSLDAVKRLHDALLPGWQWIIVRGPGTYKAVEVWQDVHTLTRAHSAVPARAWLLAVLKALENQHEK